MRLDGISSSFFSSFIPPSTIQPEALNVVTDLYERLDTLTTLLRSNKPVVETWLSRSLLDASTIRRTARAAGVAKIGRHFRAVQASLQSTVSKICEVSI